MANPHPKCEICRLRHRPGNCRTSENALRCIYREGNGNLHYTSPGPAQGIRLHSIAIPVVDLTLVLAKLDAIGEELAALAGRLPCVEKSPREIG